MTVQKHVVFCKQTAATSKVKEHEPYIYLTPVLRRSAQQGLKEGQGVEGWRLVKKYVEQGINLNASYMC